MAKVKKSITIDETIAQWLDYNAEKTDVPISRTIEKAIRNSYKVEIQDYIERKGDER